MTKDPNGKLFLDTNGFYMPHTRDEIEKEINYIIDLWESFLEAQDEEHLVYNRDYFIHKRNLYEVIKRLDKRRTYYYVFHKIERICEYKEIGIMCYWINTLKPFMVVNEKSKLYNAPNEMFSLYIIVSVLAAIYKVNFPDEKFVLPDSKTVQDYVYNFKYCDLNREAMIFFVETLAKSYNIGMETKATVDKRVVLENNE